MKKNFKILRFSPLKAYLLLFGILIMNACHKNPNVNLSSIEENQLSEAVINVSLEESSKNPLSEETIKQMINRAHSLKNTSLENGADDRGCCMINGGGFIVNSEAELLFSTNVTTSQAVSYGINLVIIDPSSNVVFSSSYCDVTTGCQVKTINWGLTECDFASGTQYYVIIDLLGGGSTCSANTVCVTEDYSRTTPSFAAC